MNEKSTFERVIDSIANFMNQKHFFLTVIKKTITHSKEKYVLE